MGPRASSLASIGIDFGTTNSRMAWYDPRIGGAEIKLQRDAEEGYVHEEVKQVVITCPARFTVLQRQKIEGAGCLAGFEEVALLEEPVAGALIYSRAGLNVGKHVLVKQGRSG